MEIDDEEVLSDLEQAETIIVLFGDLPEKVSRFEYDHWVEVDREDLSEGNEVLTQDPNTNETTAAVIRHLRPGSSWLIPVDDPGNPTPIKVFLETGEDDQALAEVMDGLQVALREYPDGTCQLREDEIAPHQVFSPRLGYEALKQFMQDNLARYRDWIESVGGERAIEEAARGNGKPYPVMDPWWFD